MWIFLRSLGVIYFIAFASLGSQVLGLIGSQGLLPATKYLQAAAAQFGSLERLWSVPTCFWLADSDVALRAGIALGLLGAGLLVVNIAPRICCIVLWALYLSFVNVGQDFFLFQWDNLLLEAGFISIFLAPAHLLRGKEGEREPSRLARWLLLWLLFRLSVQSALSKWLGGDAAWRDGSAMDYYYETAPIPTWLGWWAHQLPHGFHAASVFMTYLMEGIAPLALIAPRRWRIVGCLFLIGFQFTILLTANYTFFNWLSIALCLAAIDDSFWRRWIAPLRRVADRLAASCRPPLFRLPRGVSYTAFGLMILLTIVATDGFQRTIPMARGLLSVIAPFRSWNTYGLFSMMTKERWELEIQGSMGGVDWKPHIFRYKAGPLDRAPPFVAPHQPRLDFQCWFLTFDGYGDFRRHRYVVALLQGICAKNPTILRLLENDPFPNGPPRYLRLQVHRYEMTSPSERRETGRYWKIVESRPWSPLIRCEE